MAQSRIHKEIHSAYQAVKSACQSDWCFPATGTSVRDLVLLSLRFLSKQCERIDLISRVPNKKYIAFTYKKIVSRPVNRDFFVEDFDTIQKEWQNWFHGKIKNDILARISYTVALAPCLAMELFDRNNKKGPATYFENFIGHLFARELQIQPRKQASLPVHGRNVRLTMDFLFDADNGVRLHLPVKMSTRERVVQAWAHQRLLDGAYGVGTYKGIMVLFPETKLDSRSHEVVEICVPDQWLAYQSLLATIHRIYYFDVPARYQELTDMYPTLIQIKLSNSETFSGKKRRSLRFDRLRGRFTVSVREFQAFLSINALPARFSSGFDKYNKIGMIFSGVRLLYNPTHTRFSVSQDDE